MWPMRWINASVAVAILLIIPVSVKADEAVVEDQNQVTLALDDGFVDRDVSLDLFRGRLQLSWDKGVLQKPTILRVSEATAVTSTNQTAAGMAVRFVFDDPSAIAQAGDFRLSFRALRPAGSSERPEFNVTTSTGPIATLLSLASKDALTGRIAAAPDVSVTPVWYDGIMRAGLASWYKHKRCLCAASPDVPKGTRLMVSREDDPSRSVVVTVNDWGPERDKHPDRVIDLDKVAFKRIGNPRGGLMRVSVEIVPRDDPRWKLGDELPPPNWKKLLAALKE